MLPLTLPCPVLAVQRARHIEVQIFGDGQGNVVAFPERECSIQVSRSAGFVGVAGS
jgi:pyruvate carboxylase